MYKRVETGIRECRNGKYSISIELPPREGHKEKSYSFHIGTVTTLEEAKEIRSKAEKYRYLYGGDCLEELEELKKHIAKMKPKKLTKSEAAVALKRLLSDHDRVYGEYTLVDEADVNYDDYDEDQIQEWKNEREALEMAVGLFSKGR